MHVWQLQEAKAKLSQVVNDAQSEPQIISRHGIKESVVLSFDKYTELTGGKNDIVAFLRASPLCEVDLNLERDKSPMRDIDL